MNTNGPHIDNERLTAYIAGEGSIDERKSVEKWIESSGNNRKVYEELKAVFLLSYDSPQSTEKDQDITFNTEAAWQNVTKKVGLKHKENDVIDFKDRSASLDQNKRESKYIGLKVAASLFIGVSLIFFLLNTGRDSKTIVTYENGINEYILPDSSKVVFNGAGILTYEKGFGDSHRKLMFKGEAYFDVIKEEQNPFIIQSDLAAVKVLGTAFLVKAGVEEMIVEVERGKVSFEPRRDYREPPVILQRNEMASITSAQKEVKKEPVADVNKLYWANGKLTFRQKPLQAVLDELSQIFDKNIKYDSSSIVDCRITAVFKHQKFEDILKNLSVSLSFEYHASDDEVEIISDGCGQN